MDIEHRHGILWIQGVDIEHRLVYIAHGYSVWSVNKHIEYGHKV